MNFIKKVPLLYTGSGGNVPEWRKHLQPCEWIKANNSATYIDTKYVANENTIVEIKTRNAVSGDFMIFGSSIGYRDKQFAIQCRNKQYGIEINNGSFSSSDIYCNSETFDIIFFGKNIYKVNDTILSNSINYTNKNNLSCWLHNNNRNGNSVGSYRGEMQRAIIRENDNYILNLLSVYVIDEYEDNKGTLCSSGVAGMVDVERGVFYTNDGSGVFSHGGDIEV